MSFKINRKRSVTLAEVKEMILPNLFCGGAPKSGTTTLYDILCHHPDVYLSKFKEPLFFNNTAQFEKGLKWYSETYFSGYSGQKIVGDFTPTYLASIEAPKRIFESVGGNAKFIFILRDPVDRAYSHYFHNKRDLIEELTFEDALAKEGERYAHFSADNDKSSVFKYGYLKQGLYAENINEYYKLFGKENVLVLIFEELFANVPHYIPLILKFLNIDATVVLPYDIRSNVSSTTRFKSIKKMLAGKSKVRSSLKVLFPVLLRKKIKNKLQALSNKPQKYDTLDSKTKTLLTDKYFSGDISKLEGVLNKDLKIWKTYSS